MTRVAFMDVWADAVRDEVRRAALAGLDTSFAVSYEPGHQHALAEDAEVIVPGFAQVDEALLAAAPRLRLVHKWGVGLDAIDQDALRRRGVALAVTAGANAGPVAELAIALMLAVYRRVSYVDRSVIDACRRHGKVAGIGGVGGHPEVAQRVVRRGARFLTAGIDWDLMLVAARQRVTALRQLER